MILTFFTSLSTYNTNFRNSSLNRIFSLCCCIFSLFSYVLLIFHDSYSKTNSIFIVHVFRFWVVQDWKLIISHSHYHIMLSSFLFSFIVLHKLFFIPFIVFSFRWETKWLELVTQKKPIMRKRVILSSTTKDIVDKKEFGLSI